MLSSGLHHQYPPGYSHIPTSNLVNHEHSLAPQHMGPTGLDALAHPSHQYAYHFQQNRHGLLKHRQHPYATTPLAAAPRSQRDFMAQDRIARSAGGGAPVRRRISRACDQCNQLRTKCDGKTPCAHCVEFDLTCEYVRERKKRGKASRKDLAAQQAAHHTTGGANSSAAGESDQTSPDNGVSMEETNGHESVGAHDRNTEMPDASDHNGHHISQSRSQSLSNAPNGLYGGMVSLPRSMSLGGVAGIPDNMVDPQLTGNGDVPSPMEAERLAANGVHNGVSGYGQMEEFHQMLLQQNNGQGPLQNGTSILPQPITNMQSYGDNQQYQMISPTNQQAPPNAFRMPTGESPLSAFLGSSPVAPSPSWLSLPSPPNGAHLYAQQPSVGAMQNLRYPVLQPLLPHLGSTVPVGLACDLLEFYFQSTASTFMQPISPCVLGYMFRKRSFLRQSNPRLCSPALLASMLWIGAQTSESPYLTSSPSARGKVCQKLLELTIGLLRPLVHSPVTSGPGSPNYAESVINGVALGGFGVSLTGTENDTAAPVASAGIDDIATYMHLAVVVSASEYKASSLRWWNAAWSLARELRLGRELAQGSAPANGGPEEDAPGEDDVETANMTNGPNGSELGNQQTSGVPTEEEREERRRMWWLLYTMDRHLALCYNRPLFLLDVECNDLLQPVDDSVWQAGDYYTPEAYAGLGDPTSTLFRSKGPIYECNGPSIFGFFTPLMTILGEIVDLNQARKHPRFGLRFKNGSDWDDQAAEIAEQLEGYGRSLQEFAERQESMHENSNDGRTGTETFGGGATTPSNRSSHSASSRVTESIMQTKMVVAYGTHVMHTLHILLNGKWDPISLLDDNDLWISSESFIDATGHAVSAAEAINDILAHDPDISFMPFFFGIYLLQGSFLLLLIADKLGTDVSENVVRACETIVRAHEACVVTLNTEYQRNFRKVMRSALAQVKGWGDSSEQQLRRREQLSLYRWTGDGTGLAL